MCSTFVGTVKTQTENRKVKLNHNENCVLKNNKDKTA